MLKTPDGRLVAPENILYDADGKPYSWEWLDCEATEKELKNADKLLVHEIDALAAANKVDSEIETNKILSGDENDTEQINSASAVKDVWRPMVLREFQVVKSDTVKCACLTFVPNVGKKGNALKSGKWIADLQCSLCAGSGKYKEAPTKVKETRWARQKPFKASKNQLIRYMEFKGHPVPVDRKNKDENGKPKQTTAAKEIDRLAKKTGDAFYINTLVDRAIQKTDATYALGWAPWEDGRVHSEFAYGPATGQLNSRGPNVQNALKHIRFERLKPLNLPKRFRSLIAARPGHKIWEFDMKSFHIITLGYAARDPLYIRLGRIDMHSYFASHMMAARGVMKHPVDHNMSDADLLATLGDLKKADFVKLAGGWQRVTEEMKSSYMKQDKTWTIEHVSFKDLRDQQAKPAILGKGLGMSANRLYQESKEYFPSLAAAEFVMTTYDRTFPKIIAYQDSIAMKAHKQKYLVSQQGFIRRFWDVFSFLYNTDGGYTTKHGDDYEEAAAFLVQNEAFGHIRDAMNMMWAEGIFTPGVDPRVVMGARIPEFLQRKGPDTFMNWINAAELINTVHDSLVFELPNELDNVAPKAISSIMERKSKILVDPLVAPDGLWCAVDAQCGPNWAEMKDYAIAA